VPQMIAAYVVGVAKDVRSVRLERMDFTCLYFPVTRAFGGNPTGSNGRAAGVIAMRARSDEGRAVAAVQRVMQSAHPGLQAIVGDSRTAFTDQTWYVASRMGAIAATIVGVLGLLMAAVGIHGTVAFAVTQRTREVGVRMALGASRTDVLRLVLFETMRPVAIGLAVGFVVTAGLSQAMHSLLFGLGRLDPPAFLGASAFLAMVAFGAGYLPARKATRADPMVALRYE
jgi:putative ABC transport system permease protein